MIEDGELSVEEEEQEEREAKKRKIEKVDSSSQEWPRTMTPSLMLSVDKAEASSSKKNHPSVDNNDGRSTELELSTRRIGTGILSKVPPELFRHIFKFLSSEVLNFVDVS